jgi:hypothetical protein
LTIDAPHDLVRLLDHRELVFPDGEADHPNTKIDELLPWKWSGAGSQAIAA